MYGSPELIMQFIAPQLEELLKGRADADLFRQALYPAPSGGADQVMFGDIVSSPDLVNKAYQVVRFLELSKLRLDSIKTVVEFGGGYGALALYIKRLLPEVSYFLIETPTVASVAYQYLQDSLPEIVHIATDSYVEPSVNIVPTALMGTIIHKADVFISQGALCETPNNVIDTVAENEWFGAKHGMLILWEHEHLLGKLAETKRVVVEPLDPWKGQHFVSFYPQRAKRSARKAKVEVEQ